MMTDEIRDEFLEAVASIRAAGLPMTRAELRRHGARGMYTSIVDRASELGIELERGVSGPPPGTSWREITDEEIVVKLKLAVAQLRKRQREITIHSLRYLKVPGGPERLRRLAQALGLGEIPTRSQTKPTPVEARDSAKKAPVPDPMKRIEGSVHGLSRQWLRAYRRRYFLRSNP